MERFSFGQDKQIEDMFVLGFVFFFYLYQKVTYWCMEFVLNDTMKIGVVFGWEDSFAVVMGFMSITFWAVIPTHSKTDWLTVSFVHLSS